MKGILAKHELLTIFNLLRRQLAEQAIRNEQKRAQFENQREQNRTLNQQRGFCPAVPDHPNQENDWTCQLPDCGNTNFGWRKFCNKCKKGREECGAGIDNRQTNYF